MHYIDLYTKVWSFDCVVTFAILAFWTPLSLMHIFLFFPPSSISAEVQGLPFFPISTECWPIGCNTNCMNVRFGWQVGWSIPETANRTTFGWSGKKKGPSICRKMLGGEQKWPPKTYCFQGSINWGRPTVKLLFGFGFPNFSLFLGWVHGGCRKWTALELEARPSHRAKIFICPMDQRFLLPSIHHPLL